MEKKAQRTYIAIDLKSFYASVECKDRGYDPLSVNLVVADGERTNKTICLAVSPSLKKYKIPGRARLFEVEAMVNNINKARKIAAKNHVFTGKSFFEAELLQDNSLELDYIVAPPRMKRYEEISAKIYSIYLRYVAPEDIHVYSIDEVFIDATGYLNTYGLNAFDFTKKLIGEVFKETGITATAGIAPNLFLCKVAMDVVAKHIPADKNGVRIAELDVISYREKMWNHRPLTDFWRVGRGIAKKLEANGMYTMGDVAKMALINEDFLFKLFGVNAEYLIDHAFGYENSTIADIKNYRPRSESISTGQVLSMPYDVIKARIIIREMTEQLILDLIDKNLVTSHIVLTIGYDHESLGNPEIRQKYKGEIKMDPYGRLVPKHSTGCVNLEKPTSSIRTIADKVLELYERIVNPILLIRRINIAASELEDERKAKSNKEHFEQLTLFTNVAQEEEKREKEKLALKKEQDMQKAVLVIKKKYGKNAIFKGTDLLDGATTILRNAQIGGHKA